MPEDMTSGQISYDLRRLRAYQIIERIPHSRAYQVTEDGLTIALFLTRVAQRLLIPGLAELTSPRPPGRSRLRQADRAYRDALTDLARQASLAALPHLQLSPAVITSQHAPVTTRHTRRNLTRNSKSLRGKITYVCPTGPHVVNIHPCHRAAWLRAQPVISARVARSRRAGNQLRIDYCEPARHDHLSCPRCRILPRVAPRALPAMRRSRSCGSGWRRGTPRPRACGTRSRN